MQKESHNTSTSPILMGKARCVHVSLSAQTVIRYDIVNCITADEHMLGYAGREHMILFANAACTALTFSFF